MLILTRQGLICSQKSVKHLKQEEKNRDNVELVKHLKQEKLAKEAEVKRERERARERERDRESQLRTALETELKEREDELR